MPRPGGRYTPYDKNIKIGPALKKVLLHMKQYLPLMLMAMCCAAGATILTVIGPNRLGDMTNVMKDGLVAGIDMAQLKKVGLSLILIYGGSVLMQFVQQLTMANVTLRISRKMRGELSAKINRVPQVYFNRNAQGDILSRITNDVSMLQQGLSQSLPGMVSSVVQFVGCFFMMLFTEWHLTLCIVACTILGFFFIVFFTKKSQPYFIARQKNLGALNGYIEEMYTCHEIVRTSRAQDSVSARFGELNEAVYDANWHGQFLSGIMMPVMGAIGNLSYVLVCVVGAMLALNGTILFGTIVSFILYVRLFTSPLNQIAQGITSLQSVAAASNRIFDFLESEELSDESTKTAEIVDPKGAVRFEHVRFSYPDVPDKIIIKDFSAEVKPGEKVAIVGPTGAGKTTMVNLLMRFFEINSGSITIDGIPISELKRDNVHQLFGMVLQDTWLFEGTVRENLVYNLKDVTDEDLERVCRACGISHFIHSLPEGYDTILSDTTTISAGQKQLFTIARAMLQNSPMLILDEATSSIDTRTELIIQRTMDELTKNRTSFIIAHRLSTIKNADLILVMNEGDVIESGTHEELLAKNGFYAKLYNSQFEQ